MFLIVYGVLCNIILSILSSFVISSLRVGGLIALL